MAQVDNKETKKQLATLKRKEADGTLAVNRDITLTNTEEEFSRRNVRNLNSSTNLKYIMMIPVKILF